MLLAGSNTKRNSVLMEDHLSSSSAQRCVVANHEGREHFIQSLDRNFISCSTTNQIAVLNEISQKRNEIPTSDRDGPEKSGDAIDRSTIARFAVLCVAEDGEVNAYINNELPSFR
jgi:hypothetical protein